MNLRTEWNTSPANHASDRFYNVEETIEDVRENFDLRRFHSAEGKDIEINGVVERCLVQTSSNPLRELNDFRKIHCPMSSEVKRGHYVKYEDSVWIIDTNVANIDGAYLSTRMSRCQYILRWQNSSGNVIERWGYASDQTKYSNGESGNKVLTVGDNQYALLVTIDEETRVLKRGMRFPFDFDDAEVPDIYELTNRKINLTKGTMYLTFSFDAFSKDNDKYVNLENGEKAWICDYKEPSTLPPPVVPNQNQILSTINYSSTEIKVNTSGRKFYAEFKDSDGNILTNISPKWTLKADQALKDALTVELIDNYTHIKIYDDSFIDEKFKLLLTSTDVPNVVATEIVIAIVGLY